MDNAHTTFMLDADNPESEVFDLSDSSVATAATAVRAVSSQQRTMSSTSGCSTGTTLRMRDYRTSPFI
eukprot:3640255-Pyramimonas_sp.AAC.1